ncbi:MAG: hypothetical protein K2O16_20195 [Lachnospiraceae bacterium]|nr:hypothetical protein [Lachnospiraceae bacterium]
MQKIKWIKIIISFALILSICCGAGLNVMAAEKEGHLPDGWKSLGLSAEQLEQLNKEIQPREPAPGLSSLSITDLAVDERNEIHIEIKIMGTARNVLCWSNNIQCTENIYEQVNIVSGNRVVGEYRYFHTGKYFTEAEAGNRIAARAQATNAMNPWNTLTTSRNFTVPSPSAS